MHRRQFVSFLALAPLAASKVPHAFADARQPQYGNLLVLIELKGGNDGLNTVVPFADPKYYALRIAISSDSKESS